MSENLLQNLIKDRKAPDILTCIANLSSDEVFTPPELVDKVLDLFPEEVWHDKTLRWLDPACKTGIFLRQIALRLMVGLRNDFPNEEERRQHIFKNMLFGIAITDLTAMMSRRSLYTSKNADGDKSIANFSDTHGNIFYDNRPHTYKNGSCIYCGNKEGGELDRDEVQERHAYNFIHLTEEEAKNMKFDIIVGNPPYQHGNQAQNHDKSPTNPHASPIYQHFISNAKKLNPRYIAFIIPSRWFAGGRGLDDFRKEMLTDHHLKVIYDYPNAEDCFPGVSIEGGVMYFIRDDNYSGDCEIHTILNGNELPAMKRSLDEYDTFIRYNEAVPILRKILSHHEETVEHMVSSQTPFGLLSNFNDFDQINNPDKIKVYAKNATGYIRRERIQTHKEWIDAIKVYVGMAYGGVGSIPWQVIGQPIVATTPSCCTQTYIVAGIFRTEQEASNYVKYMKTRFFRFLVSLRKTTQHLMPSRFAFVPNLSMNQEWTDEKLYERYELTSNEINFIESMVKEMK